MHKLKQILNRILVTFFTRRRAMKSEDSMNISPFQLILYKSLDRLPIRLWYELLETNNLELLGEASQDELSRAFADLIEQYWKLTDPIKYKQRLTQSAQVVWFQNEINVLFGSIRLAELGDKRGIDAMQYFRCSSIDQAENRILFLQTKIRLKVFEIEQQEKKSEGRKLNFYRDLAVLEQVLNRQIDPDKTTVKYWIELNKLAKELNNGRNKKR